MYSTFLGVGSVGGLAIAADGSAIIAGGAIGRDFPTTPGALQRGFLTRSAGYLAKLSADGTALVYSTFLEGVQPGAVAVDAEGNAVVAGTALPGSVPLDVPGFQKTIPTPCGRDILGPFPKTNGFVAKLNSAGSALLYSTYLTGSCGDVVYGLTLTEAGSAYVTGETYSLNFPVTSGTGFPGTYSSGFVARISPAGDQLEYSALFGGGFLTAGRAIALGATGEIYVAGSTQAKATEGAYARPVGSACSPIIGPFSGGNFFRAPTPLNDAFVARFRAGASAPDALATFGGGCEDTATSLVADRDGAVWAAGGTVSSDFTTKSPVEGLGLGSGFVVRFNPQLSVLDFSAITANPGTVVLLGDLYLAGTSGDSLSSGLVARVDRNTRFPFVVDRVSTFGTPVAPLSAFFLAPAISPGQIVRINGRGIGPVEEVEAKLNAEGRLPTSIGGVHVLFGGTAAPLVRARADEIVAFVPFGVDGAKRTTVQVEFNGQRSNRFEIAVRPQSPDYISIANADGSLNSPERPALVGETVALYLTGLGQTTPASLDGAVNRDPAQKPSSAPMISVNGFAGQPSFIGAAPGQVAGLTQINLRAPDPLEGTNFATVYVGSAFTRIYIRKQ